MYPEYPYNSPIQRGLRFLIGYYLVDERGSFTKLDNFESLYMYMFDNNLLVFTDSLVDDNVFPFLQECVTNSYCKVLCTKYGKPLAVRMKLKNSTRWIVTGDAWGQDTVDSEFLGNMKQLYDYVGVGVANTPSSLGNTLMRYIHTKEHLDRTTSLSIAVEDYLHKYSFGGIVHTLGVGYYDLLSKYDKSSAYLSKWGDEDPDGSATYFNNGHCESFVTYFANCRVTIERELPLGPFPIRKKRGKISRVVYPTIPGVYDTFLWHEQVSDARRLGCDVRVREGIGWRSKSSDGVLWSRHVYWLRKRAPSEFIERCIKSIAVSAIGRHSSSREHFSVVDESRAPIGSAPILDSNGEPIGFFIVKDYDSTSALLVHKNKYTIMQCNRDVFNFALPFAERGTLVSVDYDSILALEHDELGIFIRRHSVASLHCEPGTWLYEPLSHVTIPGPRSYIADEGTKLPGVSRKEICGTHVSRLSRALTK